MHGDDKFLTQETFEQNMLMANKCKLFEKRNMKK